MNDLRKEARKKAKDIAEIAESKLHSEFRNLISGFYGEYSPTVYRRTDSLNSKYFCERYHLYTGNTYWGGIKINPSALINKHPGNTEDVFNTFMWGWHGPLFMDLTFGTHPLRDITYFQRELCESLTKK